jgi:hypothetical protein
MNFPVGMVIQKGAVPFDVKIILQELQTKSFNGYIIQSIKSASIEEGILFIREGKPVASIVECLRVKQILKSMGALTQFLNQTKGKGFFQVVELSRSQVDLVTAFDEKMMFGQEITLKDVTKLIPSTFAEKFANEGSEVDIFEAHGLGGLR